MRPHAQDFCFIIRSGRCDVLVEIEDDEQRDESPAEVSRRDRRASRLVLGIEDDEEKRRREMIKSAAGISHPSAVSHGAHVRSRCLLASCALQAAS